MDITAFPVDWGSHDIEVDGESRAEILCWGKSIEGQSTLIRIQFTPYFFVKVPPGWSDARQRLYINDAVIKYNALHASSMPVKRVPLLGYTNNTPTSFIQLAFPTLEAFRRAKYGIVRDNFKTFEANLDPVLRFFHVRNIQPAAWIHAKRGTVIDVDDPSRVSKKSVLEIVTTFTSVDSAPEITAIPKLVIASWDLECVSESGMFPDSSKEGDHIITIGTALQYYGDPEPYRRSAITLESCDPIQGVDVVSCTTEGDVVNEWIRLLEDEHVDVLIGYNTLGFDYKYLDGRHSLLVDDDGQPCLRMQGFGKALRGGGQPVEKKLSSAAYGDNKYFYLTSPGVMCLDLLQIFRKELKLDSYSLNNVSKTYLDDGDEKIDLKPAEIFAKFTQGSRERAEIASYCVRDVELPLKLMRRLSTIENTMQMANVVCCPIDYLQNRGQQIRVFSQLVRKARSLGFVCPDVEKSAAEGPAEKYEGATVLNADRGAYFDIISALDFASLYPSIIRAHNMCPSTLVMDPKYAHVDGIEYYEIETGAGIARFAQDVKCVVPALLEELSEFRKKAKRDMAAAKDPFEKAVLNAKQLSYKISANSVYGFFGAVRGMLPLVVMAAAVTATGRRMIEHSKKMAEELVPGTKVIYGDSVAGYTPIIVRRNGVVEYVKIQDLCGDRCWEPASSGKESIELYGVETYTERGWTKVDRIIRHALHPEKHMVRVLTRTGLVDVTSDHSLLLDDATPVRPGEVSVGTSLLHFSGNPFGSCSKLIRSSKEARILGFFLAHGSCRVYHFPTGSKASWAVTNASLSILQFYKHLCEMVFPDVTWEIQDTLECPTVYKLCPVSNGDGHAVVEMSIRFRDLMYDATTKVVPTCILNAPHAVKQAFWNGLYEGRDHTDFDDADQMTMAGVFALGDALGYTLSIVHSDPNMYELNISTKPHASPPTHIQTIDRLPHEIPEYVYDLTTSNHHFCAGIGKLVVHNTDSIMCRFKVSDDKRYDMHEHFRVAQMVADSITKTFKCPIELEFEKTYWPYLLFSKKRYAGRMFTKPNAPDYVDVKGLQLVRRDSAPIVRDVSNEILDMIMNERSSEKAILAARESILNVLRNKVPLEKFIISKALRSGYKNPDSLPHVAVAKKLKERRGYPPASGERVPYVFIRDAEKPDGLQSLRAEDPDYVREHPDIELDTLYYIHNQLISPITTLLEVLMESPDRVHQETLGHPDIAPFLTTLQTQKKSDIQVAKRVRTNVANKQHEITRFFVKRTDA